MQLTWLSSNLRKLSLFKMVRWAMLIMPIIILFYQSKWLTMTEIFLLQSVFWWAVVLLEIPTWYFWDMLRRKDGLFLWSIFWLLWWTFYHFANGFYDFFVAEVLLALAFTFYSWSDTALLYDTLLSLWRADDFKKEKWSYLAFGNFAEAWWALLWWWLALSWYSLVTLVQLSISALWCFLAFSLVEPERKKFSVEEAGLHHIFKQIKLAFSSHVWISSLLVYSAFTGLSTMFWVRMAQPYWESLWIPLLYFWILWAIGNFSVGLFSFSAHKLSWVLWDKFLVYIFPLCSCLAYFVLWSSWFLWTLVFMFFFYWVRWVSNVIYMDLINKRIGSENRATILSVKSLLFRMWFLLFWPLVWYVIDAYWLTWWIYFSWLVSLLLWLVGWFLLYRSRVFA